jgi:CxxC motif-containing protein (DUF1111 family)
MKHLSPLVCALLFFAGCNNDDDLTVVDEKTPAKEYSDEYYAGGKAGTVFIASSFAYKQPVPCVDEDATLYRQFMRGERVADKSFVSDTTMAYSGLGPVYIRKSCIACHPSYGGHGARTDKYDSNDSRCSYLLMVYDPASPTLALASKWFTGMTQTRAVAPFQAPINEDGIHIDWVQHVDTYGNKYEDGTPYALIYPKVTIEQGAILFDDFDMSKHAASIEATIGIYGTGLLDAISDDDLRQEYADQQARSGNAPKGVIGGDIDETGKNPYFPGVHPGRFTYLCTRATLDNGPGANAIWNITNVITDLPDRTGRSEHYITAEYARVSSEDPNIQAALGLDKDSVYNYLMSKSQKAEMTTADYEAFMVWHRGLAVPAARNLDDSTVQRGKELFTQTGCVACHRPSWTTRDNYTPMPALSKQKIYPYTDLLRHDLGMLEAGRIKVCRTTPLWGKGLTKIVSGHTDKLHDLRARNYEEAILWHGGEALQCKEKFRAMTKEEREALVKFLDAI